jgi:hypothetical protein
MTCMVCGQAEVGPLAAEESAADDEDDVVELMQRLWTGHRGFVADEGAWEADEQGWIAWSGLTILVFLVPVRIAERDQLAKRTFGLAFGTSALCRLC